MTPLNEYPDPAHCPQWAINPLKFQQSNKVAFSPGFDAEADLIKQFYTHNMCDSIIDLGCWTGVLALKTHRAINPVRMILIDALPMYLRMSRELFQEHGITQGVYAHELCVVPEPEKFPGYFRIDLSNSLNTSNILVKAAQLKNKIIVQMPTVPASSIPESAAVIQNLLTDKTHLKIDLDSIDYALVNILIAGAVKPTSMNFECLAEIPENKSKFRQVLQNLQNQGYSTPDPNSPWIDEYDMFDLFVCPTRWAAMTYKFDAVGAIYKNTIHSHEQR